MILRKDTGQRVRAIHRARRTIRPSLHCADRQRLHVALGRASLNPPVKRQVAAGGVHHLALQQTLQLPGLHVLRDR